MERRDILLSSLHEAQAESGRSYLKPEALSALAKRLVLSKAELRGVATYYSMYSLKPRGRHLLRVCDSPVCRMLGSGELLKALEAEFGLREGGTSADGELSLERCQCLGHCASAPVLSLDGAIVEAAGPAAIQALRERLSVGASPDARQADAPGPSREGGGGHAQ